MKIYISILTILFSFNYAGLLSPENGSHLNYIHILFEWEQETDAEYYNLQLDTSPSFSNPILDINDESLIYIDTENINWNSSYHWRVRPINSEGIAGDWIENFSFSTGNTRSEAYSINHDDTQYADGVTIFSSFFNYYSAMLDQNGNEIWNTQDENIVYYNSDLYGQLFGCYVNNDIENYLPGIEFDLNNEYIWQEPNDEL